MGCRWCDTAGSQRRRDTFVVRGRRRRIESNPVDAETAAGAILDIAAEAAPVTTASLTGGEPLEQPGFVTALARRLSAAGLRIYLETNGIHAGALDSILPYVDVLAMDVKLPSAVGSELWAQHADFLSRIKGTPFEPGRRTSGAAAKKKDVFVKVVVDDRSGAEEVEKAARLVAAASTAIPLVLQPEAGTITANTRPPGRTGDFWRFIEDCGRKAETILDNVRVIPQNHKILGMK